MSNKKEGNGEEEQKPMKGRQLILVHAIEDADSQLKRPATGLWLSGFSAGLDIGFSVLLMTVMLSLFKGVIPDPWVNILVANMYPIGFILVVLGRSELFTEHTALAVLPMLQGQAGIKKLLRLWGIVYVSNLTGGAIFAFILSYFAGSLHQLDAWALGEIGFKSMQTGFYGTMLSAMLAGWMMGLLAWLVVAARETISQIVIIWIITASIGLAELHHCIVGNVKVLAALFSTEFSFSEYLSFLAPVTLGNSLGGAIFVALLKYSHVARGNG